MAKNQQTSLRKAPNSPTDIERLKREKYYASHLEKIRNAKAKSDHHAVNINVNNFVRLSDLPNQTRTIFQNGQKNKNLLIDLSKIILKPIDPCAPLSKDVELRKRKARLVREHYEAIAKDNLFMVERLLAIKSSKESEQAKPAIKQQTISLVPAKIIKRFEDVIPLPKNTTLRNKMFRPKIFFELEAKGERAFGRITFQLYTEANPLLVLNLVRFFAAGDFSKLRFPRIYASLWAESELKLSDGLNCDKFYDMQALPCDDKQLGLLCFALQDFQILRKGTLVFTINFRPLTVNDGKRFAFGKLIGGRSQFLCLHEYGTKSGKPLKEIRVTSMGVL